MSPLILEQYRQTEAPRRKARNAAFTVSSVRHEEAPKIVAIEFCAFENEKTNQILSYRDNSQPAHFARAVRSYQSEMKRASAMRRERKPTSVQRPGASSASPVIRFRKVTDADTGLAISWAKMEIKAYDQEELTSPADRGHEDEAAMNREWFALNETLRRDYMGTTRHCYIGMVATQPMYQHRGAATMLLEDLLAVADEAGVECYLEATDTAKPLYERHGFRTVNELRFDPSAYGVSGYGIERQTIMVRGAVHQAGHKQPVRSWEAATGVPGTPPSENESI